MKIWLSARPRYHVHFTPTSSSRLNQIERWFSEITRNRIRRGTFRRVRDLIQAIQDYIRLYKPEPTTLPVDRQRQSNYQEVNK